MNNLQDKLKVWERDYLQYAADNLFIINKDSDLVPFEFNRMQVKIWKLVLNLLLEGKPIRILCIKDRQIGFTTFIAGLFYWVCTLFPNKQALLAAQDIDAAAGIFDKVKLFYKKSPDELKPLRKISNRRELYFANPNEDGQLGLESRILIDTADSKELGVSKTIQLVLLSEFAIWEAMGFALKPRLIALKQAIPRRAGTAIIIETTPRGEGYVSEMWEDESNGYTKIFISSVADEQYRVEINPANYFDLSTFDEHKYGDEEEEYYLYEKEVKYWYPEISDLQLIHHEVMCRLAWRRSMIDDECEGDKDAFDREYPITIEKAFAAKGSQVFDTNRLNDIHSYLKSFPPAITVYRSLRGVTIEEDDFYTSPGGPLKVFQQPLEGFKYIIGGDVGQGVKGGDDSALSCRRIPDMQHVFTFKDILLPYNFARITYKLAQIYNNAFIGMEVNEKGGFSVVEYLLHTFKYLHLYQREVTLEIDQDKQKKYGWSTTRYTKPTMVSDYNELLVHEDLDIKDIVLIEQLKKYILFTEGRNTGLMGANSGKDDLAIADMICVQLAKYVHFAPVIIPKKIKYTLDWWAKRLPDNLDGTIGNYPKGPIN
jgi:hypothetical protein